MSAAHLDVVVTLVALECWSNPDAERHAPDLPGRTELRAAVLCARRHYQHLTPRDGERALAAFERWARGYDAVTQPLAHALSPHAVLAADLLAALDGHVSALRTAQAARRAKGRPAQAAKLADLARVNDALVAFDAALQAAMHHTRATQEATYVADQLRARARDEGGGQCAA
jgi:hypothetical protein